MMVLWWRFKVATKNCILYAASVLRLKRFPTLLYFTMSHTLTTTTEYRVVPSRAQSAVCSRRSPLLLIIFHSLSLSPNILCISLNRRGLSIYLSWNCFKYLPSLSPLIITFRDEQCNVSSIISRLVCSSVWWLCVLLHNMMMMAVMVIVWRWESLLSRLQREAVPNFSFWISPLLPFLFHSKLFWNYHLLSLQSFSSFQITVLVLFFYCFLLSPINSSTLDSRWFGFRFDFFVGLFCC